MVRKTKKKPTRKNLVKKLDTIVSKYIRLRDGHCVQCGTTQNLTNGHIFSRRHYSTRWDISKDGNCHTQCWSHNFTHGYDNYEYYKWYKDRFGEDRFEELRGQYIQTKKYSNSELEELYEQIKIKYEELEKMH